MSKRYRDLPESEKQRLREKAKAWRRANPDKAKAAVRQWLNDPNRAVVHVVLNRKLVAWTKKHAAERGKSLANVVGTALAFYQDYYIQNPPSTPAEYNEPNDEQP